MIWDWEDMGLLFTAVLNVVYIFAHFNHFAWPYFATINCSSFILFYFIKEASFHTKASNAQLIITLAFPWSDSRSLQIQSHQSHQSHSLQVIHFHIMRKAHDRLITVCLRL